MRYLVIAAALLASTFLNAPAAHAADAAQMEANKKTIAAFYDAVLNKKDYDLAIKLLNAIVDFRSDYVEAWNRRATVYYMKKDFENAVADIGEVLKREPRHFGALSGLGMIMQELGDEKHALEAFRRALDVHPKLEKIPDLVKKLTETVEGRPI